MRFATPRQTLQEQRGLLSKRWLERFVDNHVGSPWSPNEIPPALVPGLFDEVLLLLATTEPTAVPRRHCATALARLAEFPKSVSVCIDLMQAGSQVLGAFVVENSGPNAAWDNRMRNKLLGELDAVFHILAHREIQALCELSLHPESIVAAAEACAQEPPFYGLGNTPTETFNSN